MKAPWVRATVDQKTCVGCGFCEELMPDLFVLGDYTATAVEGPVPAARFDALEGAARDCPVGAISLVPCSGHASADDHEKGEDEEEHGQVREDQRKEGDAGDPDDVEAHDTERLQRREYHFAIVRNGTHDDEHPRSVSRF